VTDRRRTPTWFGPEDRPLFGWVHVPERPDGRGVVLCPSLGLEGEASQLAYRTLADALCADGCLVLRFDYHGTGDSTGELDDPGRLAEWMADIAACLTYLRDAGATSTHLVGARLGATLAARAAATDGHVASLTLWYPWTKGSQFLRYQRALRRLYAVGDTGERTDGGTEIPGFVLDPELTADLRALDTSAEPGLPDRVLVVDAADPATGEVVRPEFGPDGCERRTGTGAEGLFGIELMMAEVSDDDVDVIRGFLGSYPTGDAPVEVHPVVRTEATIDVDGVRVVERPVSIGAAGLFGILAEPAAPTPGTGLAPRVTTSGGPVPTFGAALFLNAGGLHHVGPGRQWVERSRRWAAAGVRCLRMDIGGIGDSPGSGPVGILASYPPHARDDVADGVAFLSPADPGEVVLLGLCAGAYHSLLAAPSVGVGGVAVLNPLRLPADNPDDPGIGDLIDGAPRGGGWDTPAESAEPPPAAPSRRFLGSLRDKGVFTPVVRRLPDRFWWAARLGKPGKDPVPALQRVLESGSSLYVVLGPDEWPGIGRGRTHELRRLTRDGVFAITYVPTLDHSFHVASGRKDALAALDAWVLGTADGPPQLSPGVRTIS